jgi:hypothetical protein
MRSLATSRLRPLRTSIPAARPTVGAHPVHLAGPVFPHGVCGGDPIILGPGCWRWTSWPDDIGRVVNCPGGGGRSPARRPRRGRRSTRMVMTTTDSCSPGTSPLRHQEPRGSADPRRAPGDAVALNWPRPNGESGPSRCRGAGECRRGRTRASGGLSPGPAVHAGEALARDAGGAAIWRRCLFVALTSSGGTAAGSGWRSGA